MVCFERGTTTVATTNSSSNTPWVAMPAKSRASPPFHPAEMVLPDEPLPFCGAAPPIAPFDCGIWPLKTANFSSPLKVVPQQMEVEARRRQMLEDRRRPRGRGRVRATRKPLRLCWHWRVRRGTLCWVVRWMGVSRRGMARMGRVWRVKCTERGLWAWPWRPTQRGILSFCWDCKRESSCVGASCKHPPHPHFHFCLPSCHAIPLDTRGLSNPSKLDPPAPFTRAEMMANSSFSKSPPTWVCRKQL
jgi:hypothetical protein